MKKLTLTAAVSAILFAGAAAAATSPISETGAGLPILNQSTTYQIYTSGASAPATFFDALFTVTTVPSANRLCDTTKKIYRFVSGTFSGSTFTSNSDQRAYYCVLNTGNTVANAAQTGTKKYAMFYKRNRDGSAQGVNPLVGGTEGTAVEYLNPDVSVNTTCVKGATSGNIQDINCAWSAGSATTSKSVISDLGVSDVEPILFQGVNTPSGFAAMTATDVAKLTVLPSATQVFGIVVNTKLRNALQDSLFTTTNKCNPNNALYYLDKLGNATTDKKLQVGESAACMPSLSNTVINSIFTGKMVSWKQVYTGTKNIATGGLTNGTSNLFDNVPDTGTGSADKASSDRIHICTRVNGSGTKASFAALFLDTACASTGYNPAAETGTLSESILATQVHQMSTGGAVGECLSKLNNASYNTSGQFVTANLPAGMSGSRWAIGIQGTENNSSISGSTGDYRFVKIDGFEPTLANVANGKYKNWSELTFQYNNVHHDNLDSATKSLVDELVIQAANPTVMGVTNTAGAQHSWGPSGFMAVPQSFTPGSNGLILATKPVNPLTRGSKSPALSPSTCRTATMYDGGANGLRGLQVK